MMAITLSPDELYSAEIATYNKALADWNNHPELRLWLYLPSMPIWGASHLPAKFSDNDFERARKHTKGHGWGRMHES